METILLNELNFRDNLDKCSEFLTNGEIIAFPTETVYGLGCDINNVSAIQKIYDLKYRGRNKPLSAHISDLKFVEDLTETIPDIFFILAEKFLPGPLTLILKKSKIVSDIVSAGSNTIGIRYPDNQIAIEIINHFGKPLAATSANISGQSPSVDVNEIIQNFYNKIPIIVDGGQTIHQISSTVLDITTDKYYIFREGAISKSEIEKAIKMNVIKL